jgi:predicted DNA-binding protein (MmcQ/YjbR family)
VPSPSPARKSHAELLEFALAYPGAWEDHPWGETVAKVKTKVFVFLGLSDGGLSLSVKLPDSGTFALGLEWAEPTHYGLGKAGWVTARFPPRAKPPLDVLKKWIDESYRAIAPAKLLRELDAGDPAPPPTRKAIRARPRKR